MPNKIASVGYSNAVVGQTNKRTVSGAFSQLNPSLVRELKESFNLLDKDGTGIITRDGLEEMLISLGQDPTNEELAAMMGKMASPLTFSSYLTGMSANLSQLSSRREVLAAFEAFRDDDDPHDDGSGVIGLDALKDSLLEYGMGKDDIDRSLAAFTRTTGFSGDQFMYREFVSALCGEE